MSSPFPNATTATAPPLPETVVQTVTHTVVVNRTVEVPVAADMSTWLAVVGAAALFAGFIVGFLLARFMLLGRLDPVARAFVASREVALVIGRDLRLRAYPLVRLGPQFAISPVTNAYMTISHDTKPLVTDGGRTVWLGLDLGRMIVPWGLKYDHYTELCMAMVVPRDCDSLDSPECWEKLARATAELGGWQTFVGPLRIMVSVPPDRFMAIMGHKTVQMLASVGARLEAFSLSLTRTEVMRWFTRTLQSTVQRYWVYLLIVIIIAIMGMAILGAL
mgnify:CR=1 FL=1